MSAIIGCVAPRRSRKVRAAETLQRVEPVHVPSQWEELNALRCSAQILRRMCARVREAVAF
jgi:hypothetical protein